MGEKCKQENNVQVEDRKPWKGLFRVSTSENGEYNRNKETLNHNINQNGNGDISSPQSLK